jgi:hypothetical protein
MRTRVTTLAVAIVTVLALGVGAALAAPRDGGAWTSHDAMHSSGPMRAMHAEMPGDAQADCDALHAQMSAQVGSMMGQMHAGGGMGPMRGQRR